MLTVDQTECIARFELPEAGWDIQEDGLAVNLIPLDGSLDRWNISSDASLSVWERSTDGGNRWFLMCPRLWFPGG